MTSSGVHGVIRVRKDSSNVSECLLGDTGIFFRVFFCGQGWGITRYVGKELGGGPGQKKETDLSLSRSINHHCLGCPTHVIICSCWQQRLPIILPVWQSPRT